MAARAQATPLTSSVTMPITTVTGRAAIVMVTDDVKGRVINFKGLVQGVRTYVDVAGPFEFEEVD